MPLKKLLALFVLIQMFGVGISQDIHDLEMENGFVVERIIPSQDNRFIVVSETEDPVDGEYLVNYQLFDSEMHLMDSTSSSYKKRYFYLNTTTNDQYATSVFSSGIYKASIITNSTQGATLNTSRTELRCPKKTFFVQPPFKTSVNGCFFKLENEVFIYANSTNFIKVLKWNEVTNESEELELKEPEVKDDFRVLGFQKLNEQEFAVFYEIHKSKNTMDLVIGRYNADGGNLDMKKIIDLPFISSVTAGLVNGNLVVGGFTCAKNFPRSKGIFYYQEEGGVLIEKYRNTFDDLNVPVSYSVVHDLIISDKSVVLWTELYNKENQHNGEEKVYLGNNYSSAHFFSFSVEGDFKSRSSVPIDRYRVFHSNGYCSSVKISNNQSVIWVEGISDVAFHSINLEDQTISKLFTKNFTFYEKVKDDSKVKASYLGNGDFLIYGVQKNKKGGKNQRNFVTKVSVK